MPSHILRDRDGERQCKQCLVWKPLNATMFYKHQNGWGGIEATCKVCKNARSRQWMKDNREKVRVRRNAWRKSNPEKAAEAHRRNRHKMPNGEYAKMYEAQGGKCLICLQHFQRLDVDHDHKTGRRRGLLCPGCNVGIGNLKDDPERLRRAASYLEV